MLSLNSWVLLPRKNELTSSVSCTRSDQHFRDIRVVEIEKMQQRAESNSQRFSVQDLAADIWDAAELEDATPLRTGSQNRTNQDRGHHSPRERPAKVSPSPMFDPNTVYFGKGGRSHVDYASRGQAELVVRLANLGISGEVRMPADLHACFKMLDRVNVRIGKAATRFIELAESRTGDESVREQLMEVLERWFVLGRDS